MLSLYRALLALRRHEPALAVGDYRELELGRDIYAFERRHGADRFGVVLNFTAEARPVSISGRVVLSSAAARERGTTLTPSSSLLPFEGMILSRF